MPAPITKHNELEQIADDLSHPIPSLNSIEVMTITEFGGAELLIVIADKMDASERSQSRLLQKIQNYLGFINSREYAVQCGVAPTIKNTLIKIMINKKSSGELAGLFNRCIPWVRDQNAELELQLIDDNAKGI